MNKFKENSLVVVRIGCEYLLARVLDAHTKKDLIMLGFYDCYSTTYVELLSPNALFPYRAIIPSSTLPNYILLKDKNKHVLKLLLQD